MLEYFYFEIFRKTIIGFGTLFNNIWIKQRNKSGEIVSEIKVPIEYGPTQKFLARLEQSPDDLNNPVRITLPRISFEVTGFNYDPDRKGAITQTFIAPVKTDKSVLKRTYLPVPYNLGIDLNIMTLHNDDMWQILEQILPYFQPSFTITIELLNEIGEKRDIPFVLNSINVEDNYEGNFEDRRVLIGTLSFTAKTYLFGPSSQSVGGEIINKVTINLKSNDSSGIEQGGSINISPLAGINYTNNIITNLSKDVKNTDVIISVSNASLLSVGNFITINDETLRILSIFGNDLAVQRGAYGTIVSSHVSGTSVRLITEEDNSLISPGDPYGTQLG
jgi:hypothetical protein